MPNPQLDSEAEIDKILEGLASGWRGWTHDQLDGTSFIKDELDTIEKSKAEARHAIQQMLVRAKIDEVETQMETYSFVPMDEGGKLNRQVRIKILKAKLQQSSKEGEK